MRGLTLLCLLPCALPLSGCASRYVATDRGPQAYYQTGYPIRDTSAELERIFRAVKRVQVTGIYRSYRFRLADSVTAADVQLGVTYRKAAEDYSFDHTKTGTATIVGLTGRRAVLVTNEHVTALPDTVVVHFRERSERDPVGRQSRFVESVSIRTDERYLVLGLPDNRPFTVLATDTVNDVAAIMVDLRDDEQPGAIAPLPALAGDPAELVLGSFVYVLGYPHGFRMVTRGIVSEPNRTADHAFLMDGLFNRGISGGLILGVRGDTNELEWVGLAASAAGGAEYRLTPERRLVEEEGLILPYEGPVYLERLARIDYGITFAVPSTAVLRLLRQARVTVAQGEAPPR